MKAPMVFNPNIDFCASLAIAACRDMVLSKAPLKA
jgi:hypothetical protein